MIARSGPVSFCGNGRKTKSKNGGNNRSFGRESVVRAQLVNRRSSAVQSRVGPKSDKRLNKTSADVSPVSYCFASNSTETPTYEDLKIRKGYGGHVKRNIHHRYISDASGVAVRRAYLSSSSPSRYLESINFESPGESNPYKQISIINII